MARGGAHLRIDRLSGAFRGACGPSAFGKVRYTLDEVLLLCLLVVLTVADTARFGEKKLALLRRFRAFAHGTPSHDQLGTVLVSLDNEQFQQCFVAWVAEVDMVSAFAARQRLALGQVEVAEKASEIVAIPRALEPDGWTGAN